MSSKYIPEHARKQPISTHVPVEADVPPDLSQMETMRERADYDATFTASEYIIIERTESVKKMIKHIKELIFRN